MLEKRVFYKGVAIDVSLTGVNNGFSKWMNNCLVNGGVDVSNIKGNLRAEFEDDFTFYDDNPEFLYNCIGSQYDPIKNKCYFFVWAQDDATSSLQYNFIFEYDVESGIVNVVCNEDWTDALQFEEDELITAISVVHIDEERPLLYWSQRAGLRKINIYKAKQTFSGGADAYQDLVLETIDRIKYPPKFAPEIKQLTDTSYIGNNIQKGFFQFSYRNLYDDYDISAPSDWSRVNIPYFPYAPIANDIPLFQENQRNNVIWVTLKKPFSIVTKLDILVREKTSDVGTEINYDWIIYDTLTVEDITWDDNDEYVYKFYNDKIGKLITQGEANKIFDNVPLKAVGDTFAEDSRMYSGNITEGFDLEPIDVDVEFVAQDFTDVSDAEFVDLYVYQNIDGFDRGTLVLPSSLPSEFEVGGTISFQFASTSVTQGDYNFQYVIKEGDLDNYPTTLLAEIQSAYNLYCANYYFELVIGGLNLYIDNGYDPASTTDNQIISAWYKWERNCLPQFKNRHGHYFGIFYNDAGGRRSSVQKLDKYYFETDTEKVISGKYTINHTPPSWATQYNICYGGFDAGNFYQIKTTNIGSPNKDGNYLVNVDWLNNAYRYKDVTYLAYEYSVGDRIKFLVGDVDGDLNTALDFAVLGVGGYPNQILIEGNDLIQNITNNSSFLVEIYKKSVQSDLYYVIDKNDIGDAGLPTRYHKGNVQDQDYSPSANPAIQEFNGVNTYIRERYYTYIYYTNFYTFYNAVAEIRDRIWSAGGSYGFFIEMYVYNDSIGGNQINYFQYTFASALADSAVSEIANQINNPANWVSNDASFAATFVTDNFNMVGDNNTAQFNLLQTSDYPDVVYFTLKVNSLAHDDEFDDDGIQSFSTSPTIETKLIEDPNQSDIFVGTTTGDGSSTSGSAVTSFGKPNIINNNFKQITRENTIWHSGKLIPESNINGLSSYNDGQFRDYQYFGSIQKLFSTDRNLRVYMELRVGWIPIKQYLAGGDGENLVLNNDQILTDMVYYQDLIGIGTHPESHAHFAGNDYFISPNTGSVARLGRDGITLISNVKDENGNYLVRQYLYDLIKNNTGNFTACFNQRRNSYEVNIGGCVVVWDEKLNNWVGGRDYDGEIFGSAGVDMVSFKNGELYLHEANTKYNNFYNEQYSSSVSVVSNEGSDNKLYTNISTKSTTAWAAPFITNDIGQKSLLVESNFREREGVFYAEFKRDMNTVNVSYPIINGKPLRDIALLVKLENFSLQKEVLKFVNFNHIISK
ncbi:hypothetical protein [uncultured Flavobacterium sp.]|uniref:hypothetical protein n=1 Tax=uncultured Flavobacterium sp. TaxID=165435 RepID=UPI00259775C4|nr:hypothetical protein [uncultured Flavobacterium sp.]